MVAPGSEWLTGNFEGSDRSSRSHWQGKTDILWRQSSTGTLAEWRMDGSTILSSNVLNATPDSTWLTQAKPANFA
jgi:hypothetical protein